MATYDNDLRLKEIATGDESGGWGTSTNTNLSLIADAFGYGSEAITTNADTHTTTIADFSADAGRALYLKYTGTLDSACTITLGPNTVSKVWIIENATSGSQNIIIKQGSGATVTIAADAVKVVYSDGGGSGAAVYDAFSDLALGGTPSAANMTISTSLTASTSVKTPLIEFTDGDNAIAIADGGGVTIATSLDMNGTELILDADADTSITADTDDQIDFKVGNTDQVKLNIKTERLPKEAVGVLSISLITIFLWLSSSIHGIPESVIALFAVTYFSFFGFIDKHDLQTLSWDILILIWGGLALGKGLQSSGFAEWLLAQDIFAHEGFVLMIVFAIISVLLSSFISNTVAANLLIPIALNLQSVNQVHLAIIVAISSSFAMVLPISTPPNTMVFSTGIIPSRSMLKAGPIISILGVVLLLAYYQIFLSH